MITFKKVTVSNFKGYGKKPTILNLDRKKPTLILGYNEDIGNQGNSKNGVGKCLGKDTPILMYDGTTRLVQNITVGDKLMGPDGTPRNVMSLATGREELFRVKQNIGDDYVVNRSHILSLRVGTTRPKYGHYKGEVINIPVEEYLSYPESVKKGVCGYVADLTDLDNGKMVFEPWLIGLWLADGTSSQAAITYNVDDNELYDQVREIAGTYDWKMNLRQSDDSCFTEYYAGGFQQVLRSLGLLNDKHIPREYLMASYCQRLDLLAGILDGDGWNNRGRSVDIVLKDNQLPRDLAFLARSVGLRVSMSDKFSKCQNFDGANYKRLTISGDVSKIPYRLSRKQGTGRPSSAKPRHYGSTGISLESIGEGDYYGFEIDGDRLFCLGDFTVTHNTTMLEAVVFCLYGKGLSKAKADELVNFKNDKKTMVVLDFEVNGKECQVKRGRKPNVLELTVDGTSLSRDSMKNTDSEIQKLIGITYDVFLSTFFLNPFKESFMSLSAVGQKNHIEQILSLDVLAQRASTLKDMKKDLAVDIKLKQKDVDAAIAMNEHLKANLKKLQQREQEFEEERQKDLASTQEALDQADGIDFQYYIDLLDSLESTSDMTYTDYDSDRRYTLSRIELLEDNIEQLLTAKQEAQTWTINHEKEKQEVQNRLDSFPPLEDIEAFARISDRINGLETDLFNAKNGLNNLHKELENINSNEEKLHKEFEVLDSGQCPYCEQRHTDEDKLNDIAQSITDLGIQRDKLKVTIETYQEKIESIANEKSELEIQLPDIDESITETDIERCKNELDRLERQENESLKRYNALVEKHGTVEAIQNAILEHQKNLNELVRLQDQYEKEMKRFKDKHDKITSECEKYVGTTDSGEIRLLWKEVDMLSSDIEKIKSKKNPYSDQIKEAEHPKDISYLENELDHMQEKEKHIGYLVKLLTDPKSFIRKNIVDQFLPYLNKRILNYTQYLGLPHVAEIQNDMTVDIDYMGKSVSYHTMSRGEMLRLDAATSLAFRDLIGVLGISTNLMLVDEYVDSSLDGSGVEMIMSLLSEKCPNLFLISHKEQFVELIDDIITVTKRNGFSFIE